MSRRQEIRAIENSPEWSSEEERVFFEFFDRARSDWRRYQLLWNRARAIPPKYPEAAITLLEKAVDDYADQSVTV